MPQTVVEQRTHVANTLTAKSLKATLVLAPNEVIALAAPSLPVSNHVKLPP